MTGGLAGRQPGSDAPKKVEFFYDYVSPYSYLADSRLATLRGAEVIYRPMYLGAVMQATGNRPPATVEARGRYMARDLERWARRYGVPFRMNSRFPQNTLAALRVALAAAEAGCFDAVHRVLFEAMFVHDRDLGDPEALAAVLQSAGADAAALMTRAGDAEIKDGLRRNTDEAVARGAFGAPSFFVGDELYFGNDRLSFVEAALAD